MFLLSRKCIKKGKEINLCLCRIPERITSLVLVSFPEFRPKPVLLPESFRCAPSAPFSWSLPASSSDPVYRFLFIVYQIYKEVTTTNVVINQTLSLLSKKMKTKTLRFINEGYWSMACLEGLEPATSWFVVKHSIQLSYRHKSFAKYIIFEKQCQLRQRHNLHCKTS